ncbi:hypothetical protein GQ600_11112 [Phytophthora cactorum]|nr:hypothetical protein GQ600_11112 [Phytophthora cactorum]
MEPILGLTDLILQSGMWRRWCGMELASSIAPTILLKSKSGTLGHEWVRILPYLFHRNHQTRSARYLQRIEDIKHHRQTAPQHAPPVESPIPDDYQSFEQSM